MRPVSKSAASTSYNVPATFKFAGPIAAAVRRVLKCSSGRSVAVSDCLEAWLYQVRGGTGLGGTKSERAKVIDAIKAKVTALYKSASVPLTQELGPFCSFCETPLPGLLEVEHCVPKSEYPTFSLLWSNFLLACSPCNTAKSNDPPRATVQGWLGGSPQSEQDFYDEIRLRHYVWADVGGQSYRTLPLRMEIYDAGSNDWVPVPMNEAVQADNFVISHDISKREVQARIHDPNDPSLQNYREGSVRVAILSAGPGSRCNEMLSLCNLNGNGNLASTFDRRVLNRTITWFRCLKVLKSYNNCQSIPAAAQSSWQVLLQNAATSGFYSVWLTILKQHDPLLARRFVTDASSPYYFPGTDTATLP